MAYSLNTENHTLIKEAYHLLFVIGETLVDESKGHYTPEEAIAKIRKLLNENQSIEKNLLKTVMEMNNNNNE